MKWLNYHHLLYFWTVAREGTIVRAAEKLLLAQPTITTQIRRLERAVGHKLFERRGRNLHLTEMGRAVYQYADEIFSLGEELIDFVNARPTQRPWQFTVGIDDILPKLIVCRLLSPVLALPEPVQIVCREDNMNHLLADLAINEVDMILSDTPITPTVKVRGYNHLLGQCGTSFLATPDLARQYRRNFPRSLHAAPMLLPMENTSHRKALDQFLGAEELRPAVRGEFDDDGLLQVFGRMGAGVFPIPTLIEPDLLRLYDLKVVGRLDNVTMSFYAISGERKLRHPAVLAVSQAARNVLSSE
ncbi:MAG: transcriptional activator NhaR [Phycisphaerae bacterium]|nr:transcriptional activator NhaR [Phycisphaerae bacterium]